MKEIKSHLEPALGSKENPIVITNENEYNQVHYDLYYSYSCKNCGHECIRKKRSSEKEKVLQRRPLCKNCGLIDTSMKNKLSSFMVQELQVCYKIKSSCTIF